MSFTYSINNFGPKVEPWGTPNKTSCKYKSVPLK